MALKEIVMGMVLDFQMRVEQSTCRKALNISDIDIANSSLQWQKPDGTELNTGVALLNTGSDGMIVYSMINPPTSIDIVAFDQEGIWKVKYELLMNTGHILKPFDVMEFEVKKDTF